MDSLHIINRLKERGWMRFFTLSSGIIIGNFFFRIGRIILRVITFGSIRLENPTRFQMFVVAPFGFLVSVLAALLLLNLARG